MKQNPGSPPNRDPVRSLVARKIRHFRGEKEWEAYNLYNFDRSGAQYINNFRGLQNLFRYVAKLRSNVVLDIGAGTTRAIHDLSRSKLGSGLEFKATVLRYDSEIKKNLGAQNVHITPVETLKRISDSSVGCALAHMSIGYSVSPMLAIKSIDRVLVPGGVLKASFPSHTVDIENAGILKGPQEFWNELKIMGYDIDDCIDEDTIVLLAVKPGSETRVDAGKLLHEDESTSDDQLTAFYKGNNEKV